jgi:tRNA threonylcarbamoyladenosine biosynthesis protein TsaE
MARMPMVRQWPLPGPKDTRQLGAALAAAHPADLTGPRLVYLSGELGSGKTTLVAALLQALGIDEPVRSPSFALLELYPLPSGLAVHVDCYRLRGAQELEALGLRDYFIDGNLVLIEWPEHGATALPDPDLALQLRVEGEGRSCRALAQSAAGERWLGAVETLRTSPIN